MTENKGNAWNNNKANAIKKLSAGLATRYGKELNSTDKGFNIMMNDFSEGKFGDHDDSHHNSFRSVTVQDAKGRKITTYYSDYDAKGAGFTAAGMSKATPGALQRTFEALANGDIKGEDLAAMATNANLALDDDIISKDLKKTEKGLVQSIAAHGAMVNGNGSVITSMGKNSLDNLALVVEGLAKSGNKGALNALGRNIEAAAKTAHLFGEDETKAIQSIVEQLNAVPGGLDKTYTFNPSSMQVN